MSLQSLQPFVYNSLPGRVIFGRGTLSQVGHEIQSLGCSKALVLTTPGQSKKGEALKADLGSLAVGIYTNATLHNPTHVADDAVELVKALGADCVVALGGGSTIGLAKAIALRTDLPQIVVPTTYSGSEATPLIGQTENGLKTTQKTLKVLPEVIIYDIDLTLTLPVQTSITSGINAIAHALEALYSTEVNPITDMLAEQGIGRLVTALQVLHKDPQNIEARSDALFGAWACGTCLGGVNMALHHKLCHTLGGTFNLPHAETHTILLPHTIAYNEPFAVAAMAKASRILGAPSAGKGVFDLAKNLGAPSSLKDIGMKEEDLERAADVAMKSPYPNPAPLERAKILGLLRDAYGGRRPA
ncbi:iron-containing alcohol dehydrogenase [Mycena alexandri]|uniref:Iron-containing alcohol dehydrogenase n=1 Tax=Mycena alexandri TaxID=1745969 RepID=A0AAD6SZA0_9AGAR|nr:iron-containing alcohol dehydrogenase [Mycena alexandri]